MHKEHYWTNLKIQHENIVQVFGPEHQQYTECIAPVYCAIC